MADHPGRVSDAGPFADGGEMGALMRAHDWPASSLGPREGWSPALRTIVDLMIDSRHPMFVAWGPELAFLYNDAYSPILGAKHPNALGLPFKQVWSDIWSDIWPLIERALAGEATWFEDLHLVMERNGYPEDTWYTFSYSPARDESGAVAGMFCACTETTGKVRAEAKLRESETLFRTMADNAPVMVWTTDPDGSCTFLSRSWYEFTGQTEAEALGLGWLDATHPEDAERAGQVFLRANAAREPFTLEYRLRRSDGAYRWAIDAAAPRFGEDGTFLGYIGSVIDISERHESERALRESAEELQTILDAVPAAIWIARDPESREIVGNRASYELLRLEQGSNASLSAPGDDGPQGFTILHGGRELDADELPVQAAARGELVRNFEEEVRFDDGSSVTLFGNASPLHDSSGAVRGAVAAFVDITAAKRAEDRLRESEERFHRIADSAPVPMWVTQLDRTRSFANRAYADFLGLSYDEALVYNWRESIHPDDIDRLTAESIAGEASLKPFVLEGRYRRADGEWRWLRSESQPRWGPDGEHVGFIGVAHDVTDAKEAEAAQRQVATQLRLITDALPVLISYVDRDGRYQFNNKAYEDWFGRSREDMRGRTMRDVLGDAAFTRIEPLVQRALSGERVTAETQLDYRDAGQRHVHVEYVPARNDAGEVDGFYVLVNDIGEQKHTEEALRIASQQAEADAAERSAILQQLAEGVIVTDADGRISFVNAAAAAIHGVARLDVAPDEYTETYHLFTEAGEPYPPEDLPLSRAVLTGATVTDARWRIRRPDGTEVLAIGSAQPIVGADGERHGAVLTLRDDTARRAAEAALEDREEQFRNLADNISQFAWTADREGWIYWYNQRWHDYTGTTLEEMEGWGWTKVHHPDHADRIVQSFKRSIDSGEVWEDIFPLRSKNGEYRWFLSRARPIRDGDGTILRWFGTNTDITDQRAAEERLKELNETLEARVAEEIGERMKAEETLRQAQKMEAIGQLTGGIAHDFNNLLTVIMSSVDLLRRPELAPDRRQRYIDAIGETATRAAALTGQLLAFARRQPLSAQAFDMGARLKSMEPMLRTVLGATIELSVDPECDGCLVDADPNQLDSAVLNMAVNARDAMPGGGRLDIGAAPSPDGAWIDLTVADSGAGIDAAALGSIFEPFYTTKSVGKGTGLGLSQVYGFAKQSGGEIGVESVVGKGSVFTLRLPRSSRDAADGEAAQTAAGPAHRNGRILVVEDNREVGESAVRLLEDMGHEVTLARDAATALDLVLQRGEAFDAVFSDVIMPGAIDGLGLARLLREQRPGLPVILTTGYSHSLAEDATHGFEVLRKPYRAEALMRLIGKAMRSSGAS